MRSYFKELLKRSDLLLFGQFPYNFPIGKHASEARRQMKACCIFTRSRLFFLSRLLRWLGTPPNVHG